MTELAGRSNSEGHGPTPPAVGPPAQAPVAPQQKAGSPSTAWEIAAWRCANSKSRPRHRLGMRGERRMDNGAAMVKLGKSRGQMERPGDNLAHEGGERTARERWSKNMRDAAELFAAVTTAKLNRELDERECKRRNALSQTSPGLVLRAGDVGTVVETFGPGE